MTINIPDNTFRELLKQVFCAGYNSPVEEKASVLDSILSSLKEKEMLKAPEHPGLGK